MTTSFVTSDSLLAIDIGTIKTRAFLFDVVDGRYRFVASGIGTTTAGTPFHDVGEGVRHALDRLEAITGRVFIGGGESLIMPSKPDGSGVDLFTVTQSVGQPIQVVVVGLLEDVSVESAKRLASTTYTKVIETIKLNDRRSQDARIDTILHASPELVIFAGGTEGGASQSVLKLLEAIGLACYLMPQEQRPQVLYTGNHALQEEVRESLEPLTSLHISPNIRPTLEVEQLDPAQTSLANIFRQIRSRQILGVSELDAWSGGRLLPGSMAFGRIIRFLSQVYDPAKGVLGIDIGASAITLAAAVSGKLSLNVYPELGLAAESGGVLQHSAIEKITRWLSAQIPTGTVRDYLYNRSLYPASLPATVEEMDIEQAMARQAIRVAVEKSSSGFIRNTSRSDLLPGFEPIVATGGILTKAPSVGQSMLTILDGLQPTGVTTIVLDKNNMAAALGGAAEVNPALVVQILESNAFLNLGTVISPVGNARPGTPVLRIQAMYEDGKETKTDVKFGSLEILPVPFGKPVNLRLQPLHRFDVGMGGPGRGGRLRVVGGVLGVVIDARGRPINLHQDPNRRRALHKKWLWTLG
jgi:uncharacterized protein (TIGR01319 family)